MKKAKDRKSFYAKQTLIEFIAFCKQKSIKSVYQDIFRKKYSADDWESVKKYLKSIL